MSFFFAELVVCVFLLRWVADWRADLLGMRPVWGGAHVGDVARSILHRHLETMALCFTHLLEMAVLTLNWLAILNDRRFLRKCKSEGGEPNA